MKGLYCKETKTLYHTAMYLLELKNEYGFLHNLKVIYGIAKESLKYFSASITGQKKDSSGLDLIKETHFLEGRGSGLTKHL